jgi:hypothetical protein
VTCYKPLQGYRSRFVNESGKRSIVFNAEDGYIDLPVTVPCGRCIGCRLEKSRQWAIRCIHEATLHDDNCFLTLTYDNEHLPEDWSLHKDHFQKFIKRLRHHAKKLRYFHCGEYGDENRRPHYHAIIFGYDFPDKIPFKQDATGRLFLSETLQKLWPYGFSTIGDVTFESAAYVARYVLKKVTGDNAEKHYQVIDAETGEIHKTEPEYVTMSRRPGIAKEWYEKFKGDCYPSDFITHRGMKMRPPAFYDKQLEKEEPDQHRKTKAQRMKAMVEQAHEQGYDRLRIKEKVKEATIKQLTRII